MKNLKNKIIFPGRACGTSGQRSVQMLAEIERKNKKKSLTLQETIDILKVFTQRDFPHPMGLGIRQAIEYLEALKVIKGWTNAERR